MDFCLFCLLPCPLNIVQCLEDIYNFSISNSGNLAYLLVDIPDFLKSKKKLTLHIKMEVLINLFIFYYTDILLCPQHLGLRESNSENMLSWKFNLSWVWLIRWEQDLSTLHLPQPRTVHMTEYAHVYRSMYLIYDITYTLHLIASISWGSEHSISLRKKKKSM